LSTHRKILKKFPVLTKFPPLFTKNSPHQHHFHAENAGEFDFLIFLTVLKARFATMPAVAGKHWRPTEQYTEQTAIFQCFVGRLPAHHK
jgi:hypothetical protein